jgi:hypothetical protein
MCVHEPADRLFAIGRTSCSRAPEYAVEVNEPGLGLNLALDAAERFANALLARLGRP